MEISASPTRRRLRVLGVTVGLAVAFALGGVVASRFMVTPAQRAATADAPPASVLTATVERRTLEDTVVTRGDVVALESVDVLAGREFPTSRAVVTAAPLATGDEVSPGALLVEVNGRPVLALPGDLPAYEDLRLGSGGPLVRQLQQALKALGLELDDPDAAFGESTARAVEALYERAGYPGQRELPMAEVAFVPTLPAKVVRADLRRGAMATDASLVLGAGGLVVVIDHPDQQLLALAQRSEPVRLANELSGEGADGTFSSRIGGPLPDDDAQGDPAGASGGSVGLIVVPDAALPLGWLGANVRVTATAATTETDVLTVPSSAIRTNGHGATIVTVVAGGERRDVEVAPGLTGGGFVAVTGDLEAGDEVLVGLVR